MGDDVEMKEVIIRPSLKRSRSSGFLPARKKRFSRKGFARAPRGVSSRVPLIHKFKQCVTGAAIISYGSDTITQAAAAKTVQSFLFQLSDLPQSASYTALFDQYRITKIKMDFIPCSSIVNNASTQITAAGYAETAPEAASATATVGLYGTVIDYDDANALASLAAATEYENFRYGSVASNKIHSRTFVPHTASAAFNGAFAGYKNDKNAWIDCAYPGVQYFGLKFYADEAGAQGAQQQCFQSWRILATYWVEFKNVR